MSAMLTVVAGTGVAIWTSSLAVRAVLLAVPPRDAR